MEILLLIAAVFGMLSCTDDTHSIDNVETKSDGSSEKPIEIVIDTAKTEHEVTVEIPVNPKEQ